MPEKAATKQGIFLQWAPRCNKQASSEPAQTYQARERWKYSAQTENSSFRTLEIENIPRLPGRQSLGPLTNV